jgi:hypothetical protein
VDVERFAPLRLFRWVDSHRLAYYDRYEYVFRNAGFVISTVLLRVSLSTPKPYDLVLALTAMLYGVAVLGVFALYAAMPKLLHRNGGAPPPAAG